MPEEEVDDEVAVADGVEGVLGDAFGERGGEGGRGREREKRKRERERKKREKRGRKKARK